MTRLLRGEAAKLVTIWSTYALIAVTALASAGIGLIVAFAPRGRTSSVSVVPPRGSAGWFDEVLSAMSLAQTLGLVLGILVVSWDYRHRTVTPSFLCEPRRERVLLAKLAVSAAGGAVVALAAGLAGLALGAGLVAAGYGTGVGMWREFVHVYPGVALAAVLFSVYGAGLAAILRNQVLALVVGLAVSGIIEPIVIAAWPTVGRWLPTQAARSLETLNASATSGAFGDSLVHRIPAWQGALVLLAYGIALAVAGSLTALRSDVT